MRRAFILILFAMKVTVFPAAETLKIGYAGPVAGDLSRFGISQLRAVRDAIDASDSPFEFELFTEDDQCNPRWAPDAAGSLAEKQVNFVIGHVCSGATIQALPVYSENNILCITASATNPEINRDGRYPNFFRTVPDDFDQGRAIIQFLRANRLDRVLLIFEPNSYSKSVIGGVEKYADQAGISVDYCRYDTGDSSLSFLEGANVPELFEVLDAAVYAGYYPEFPSVYSILRNSLNFQGPIVGSDGINDSGLFELPDPGYLKCYAAALPQASGPEAAELFQRYFEKYGEPFGPNYLNAYTAVSVMIRLYNGNRELLSLPMSEQMETVGRMLKDRTFQTSLGDISFDEQGGIQGYGFRIYEIIGNRFEMLPD